MARRSFEDVVALIAQLRGDQGCPWDRAQDHASLRRFAVEEAHELVAAIDAEAWDAVADELGDLLLQVLLHSRIAAEHGRFTLDDVIEGLAAKLVRRHPHVFSDAPRDLESIRRTWRTVKHTENREAACLPSLIAARKKIEEAAASGRPIGDRRTKIGSKTETETETEAGTQTQESRAGWMLLEAIAAVVGMGQDPELALQRAMRELDSGGGGREGAEPCSGPSSTG